MRTIKVKAYVRRGYYSAFRQTHEIQDEVIKRLKCRGIVDLTVFTAVDGHIRQKYLDHHELLERQMKLYAVKTAIAEAEQIWRSNQSHFVIKLNF